MPMLPYQREKPSRASKTFSAVRESQRDRDQLLICLYWSTEKKRAQAQVAGWQRVVQGLQGSHVLSTEDF